MTAAVATGGPARHTVLDGRHAAALVQQCSRDSPPAWDATWTPNPADIADIERHLKAIEQLTSQLCCHPGARVADVGAYHRQYVGLIVGGRRMIYINAFRIWRPESVQYWRTEPVLVCDGGTSFWGALYDPATKRFRDLAFNGDA